MLEENYCGLVCPEPVVRCRTFLATQQPSALRITVDNSAASENLSRFLSRNGYTVTSNQKHAGLWVLDAQKIVTDSITIEQQEQNISIQNVSEEQNITKTLVLIPSETFGHGDDTLGARLMENFLSMLPELGENLWKVILLNGGVKLAARSGKALDALAAIQNEGVEILVCGSCLEFYGLTEVKKEITPQVGELTNMLDVVTAMALADKIIRP